MAKLIIGSKKKKEPDYVDDELAEYDGELGTVSVTPPRQIPEPPKPEVKEHKAIDVESEDEDSLLYILEEFDKRLNALEMKMRGHKHNNEGTGYLPL